MGISGWKNRKCRIMQIEVQNQEIMIHYNEWNERCDEWLSIDSVCIVKTIDDKEHEEDNDSPSSSSSNQKSKWIIGMLLNKGSETAKKVISAYEQLKKKLYIGKKLCTNKNCKFVHIKGTARKLTKNLDSYHENQGPNARINIPPSWGGDSGRLTDPF